MSSLYHEQQMSSLCGVHSLNNLMQGPTFGAGDLASIAHQLDEAERALLDPSEGTSTVSHRIDITTGDFALEVLANAFTSRTYKDGKLIFEQGDDADAMYFLVRGRANASKQVVKGDSPGSETGGEINDDNSSADTSVVGGWGVGDSRCGAVHHA